jgi:chromosome segregation ATPase
MSEPPKAPDHSLILTITTALFGLLSSLGLGKTVLVPYIQEWRADRKARREREKADGVKYERALEGRIAELSAAVDECRKEAREARALAEAERRAREAATEAATAYRLEHEKCQSQLEAMGRRVGDLSQQVDNLRRQLGLAPLAGERPAEGA